jgi:uncharacterized integral membrane protein (TIGR00698 family)
MNKVLKNEDWLAFLAGFIVIILAIAGLQFVVPKFGWSDSMGFINIFADFNNILSIFSFGLIIVVIGLFTLFFGDKKVVNLIGTVLLLFIVSIVSQIIAGFSTIKYYGFEHVIFALLLGIAIRNIFGLPKWIEENLHTEFFIKTGLVILGTGIIFNDIVKAGSLGLLQAVIVVLSVWFFAFWIARKLKVDKELALMLSSAVSICGVSAAIATAGAIKGDSKKLSYVVSLVLIVALPMLILMPIAAKFLGLSPAQAGAWLGGTIDTTGAVVASGTVIGEEALKFSTIVKFSQNVLIGFAAVGISLYWSFANKNTSDENKKPNFSLIWDRFPKFVLGFILASVIFSFLLSTETVSETKNYLKGIQTSLFALAFVGIGLETNFRVLLKTGNGRPATAFLIAQSFNIIITLIIAWVLFGYFL